MRRYERKSVEVGVFRRGLGHFERRFQREGGIATNHCWCQKTRVIDVSCGIKIFAVRCFVFSQYTHLTDRQTDRRTNRQTELRQQCRALHYMQSHGKNDDAQPELEPATCEFKFVALSIASIYLFTVLNCSPSSCRSAYELYSLYVRVTI